MAFFCDDSEEDSWCKHARIDHNVAMTVLPAVTIDDHEWMRPDYDYTADVNSDSSRYVKAFKRSSHLTSWIFVKDNRKKNIKSRKKVHAQ